MLRIFTSAVLACAACLGATEVLFQPGDPTRGPFPSNVLTTADAAQQTNVRVNLQPGMGLVPGTPLTGQELGLVNQLDGFSLNPMLRVCFSGKVKAETLKQGIYLQRGEAQIALNRILLDPETNCMMAKPDQVLEPGSTYLLVVTNSVRDISNNKVVRSQAFSDCLKSSSPAAPCKAGSDASDDDDGKVGTVAARTRFTTLSARSWLEQAQSFVSTTADVSFLAPPAAVTLTADTAVWQYSSQGGSLPLTVDLNHLLPEVGRVSFGVIKSPNFIKFSPDPTIFDIPGTPTRDPIQPRTDVPFAPVSYHIFYPKLPPLPGGYPVAIYLHGMGDTRFGASSYIAGTLAKYGIATLSFELLGHGYGQDSVLKVGSGVPFLSPGRAVSLEGPMVPADDGCIAIDVSRPGPSPVAARDCIRQTAVDTMAIIRMLRSSGAYTTNSPDPKLQLNPNRIYVLGQSLGAIAGTLVAGVDPNVRASVLNVPGGSYVDVARLAMDRSLATIYLLTRQPPLVNKFGCSGPLPFSFEENYVFRNQAPAVGPFFPGALAIQSAFEAAEWIGESGDALAYAALLKTKRKLIPFALGDGEVPNPTNSAVIRAADARSDSRLFRFDLAKNYAAKGVIQPHRYLSNPGIFLHPEQESVALAAQHQVAGFLALDGFFIPDANWFLGGPYRGQKLFETPQSLPETLSFKPIDPCSQP